jgi:hypothetical protein
MRGAVRHVRVAGGQSGAVPPGYRRPVPFAAAAFCPHPPLLVPRFAGGPAPELDSLRAACRAAVTLLVGAAPDVFVVVGSGPDTAAVPSGTRGTLAPWGVDVPVSLGPPGFDVEQKCLPLSLAIGAWLLGVPPRPVRGQVVRADLPAPDCAALGRSLISGAERVALLVMGDGAAVDRERPQGPAATAFDTAVAGALESGDGAALLAIDDRTATGLECTGRAPWQVLAGAAGVTKPRNPRLLYQGAPYGVGYLVASWS